MTAPIFLTVEEVLELPQDQINRYGGDAGVRDLGLLESAVAAPMATMFGEFFLADIFEMAAALLFSLAKNHAFVDGNKRAAALAADVFLTMNGWDLQPDEPAFSQLVLDVATDVKDRADAAAYFREHSKPI